jgi:hypothetical protein
MCASAEMMLRPTLEVSDEQRSRNLQIAWLEILALFEKLEMELMEWRNAKVGNMIFTSDWKPTVAAALASLEQRIAEYQKRNDLPMGQEIIVSYQVLKDAGATQPTLWMYTALVHPGLQEMGMNYQSDGLPGPQSER